MATRRAVWRSAAVTAREPGCWSCCAPERRGVRQVPLVPLRQVHVTDVDDEGGEAEQDDGAGGNDDEDLAPFVLRRHGAGSGSMRNCNSVLRIL